MAFPWCFIAPSHNSWLILQVVWTVLLDAVPTGGKNGQQIVSAVAKQIKTYVKLLNAFSTTGRAEAALLVHMQVRPPLYTPLRPAWLKRCVNES